MLSVVVECRRCRDGRRFGSMWMSVEDRRCFFVEIKNGSRSVQLRRIENIQKNETEKEKQEEKYEEKTSLLSTIRNDGRQERLLQLICFFERKEKRRRVKKEDKRVEREKRREGTRNEKAKTGEKKKGHEETTRRKDWKSRKTRRREAQERRREKLGFRKDREDDRRLKRLTPSAASERASRSFSVAPSRPPSTGSTKVHS